MEDKIVIQIPIDEIEFECYRERSYSCPHKSKRTCAYCTDGKAVATTRLATPDEITEIYIEGRNW